MKRDHDQVAKLFERFDKTKEPARKRAIFEEIRKELDVHAAIEEEIFYPGVAKGGDQELSEQLEEAHGEHAKVKELLRDAERHSGDPESGEFDAGVAAIKGAVEHHVEEEEKEMFKEVRKNVPRERLLEMGARMQARKSELMGSGGRALR